MTKKIIQKVCGFVVSAAMALGSIAGLAAEVWAEESAALAGAGAEENVQPVEEPVWYRITLPWTEHLIIEPETEHISIPDPDMRTEREKKDILLTYKAGEEVEIRIWAENNWQISELDFLDEKKEETGYEWKDLLTVHFNMPEKSLIMKAELSELQIAEEVPQEGSQDINSGADPSLQAEAQAAEMQGGDADPFALQETGSVESSALAVGNAADIPQEAGIQQEGSAAGEPDQSSGNRVENIQENSSPADPVQENIQQPSEVNAGSEAESSADIGNGTVPETEPAMTYVPEKEADGLPAQGSIEQTQTLEIVRNDAGFDAKIDLRNIPYDPEQYSIEYISDDILLDTVGTYSCIYKVTAPDSGKFFFVLRPVQVVESQDPAAVSGQEGIEAAADLDMQETGSTENGSGQQTEAQETEAMESSTEALSETEASLEAAAVDETETETESEQPSGEYKVTLTKGEDLGVKLDHEDGTYNAGETVTFTAGDSRNLLIAAAALKEESNQTVDTADNRSHFL